VCQELERKLECARHCRPQAPICVGRQGRIYPLENVASDFIPLTRRESVTRKGSERGRETHKRAHADRHREESTQRQEETSTAMRTENCFFVPPPS